MQRKLSGIPLLCIGLLVIAAAGPWGWALSGEGPRQKTLETKYTTIYYPDDKSLLLFGEKISRTKPILRGNGRETQKAVREIVDRIIFRVKMLLDMHPRKFHPRIRIYRTYKELEDIYRKMGLSGKTPLAFYSARDKTIYLTVERLNDGVFAHEVAHGVINTYFKIPPPARMQEILAQYVDVHLWSK